MDSDFENFFLSDYLKDFGIYIFVCVIFGFGSMIYYFSIKAQNPAFDSPKLIKRKTKKEKQIRSKTAKIVSGKIESKVPTSTASEIIYEPIVTNEIIDDDNDSSWCPATKPKKNLKSISKPLRDCPSESDSKIPVTVLPKIIELNKPVKKPIVIESACDNTIIESQKAIEKPPITKLTVEVPPAPTEVVLTESPTNSCSDDFELVDMGKASSEDVSCTAPISSTSGASRKKNKKQQKLISKQLIDAASLEPDQDNLKSVTKLVKSKPTSATKKKRPRKED